MKLLKTVITIHGFLEPEQFEDGTYTHQDYKDLIRDVENAS